MKNVQRLSRLLLVAGLGIAGSAQAALTDLGNGLVLDDVLNVKWLKDANLAATTTFGVAGIDVDGSMNQVTAQSWIAAMNAASYLGYNTWRLPTVTPINGVAFNLVAADDGSADLGKNISAPGTVHAGSTASELAHLYYNSLGNVAFPPGGPKLSGPFDNIQFNGDKGGDYWSGTLLPGDLAFSFNTDDGMQLNAAAGDGTFYYAWAVVAVPEPESYAMMLAGLGMLGFMARRRKPSAV